MRHGQRNPGGRPTDGNRRASVQVTQGYVIPHLRPLSIYATLTLPEFPGGRPFENFQEDFMEAGAIAGTSAKDVQKALAKRLAHRELKDEVITAISKRIVRDGLKIGGVDFCPYGICIDYFSDKRILVDKFVGREKYRAVKLFPYGILVDDLWRLQVEMHVPELAGGR